MRVPVTLAVTELFHQPGRCVAKAKWDVEGPELLHVRLGFTHRDVDGVALGRTRHEHDGRGNGKFAFRTAEPVVGFPRIERHRKGARIGESDVLNRHAHGAPGDIQGVAAAVEHPAQPVQRRVGIAAADGLVQSRDLIVKLVAPLVEAAARSGGDLLRDLGCNRVQFRGFRKTRAKLQHVQAAARVSVGGVCNEIQFFVPGDDVLLTQPTLFVLDGGAEQRGDVSHGQRTQDVHARPGK